MVVRAYQFVRCVLICALMAVSASAFAGVTVTSPANGSTVGSPAHFVANASSSRPITFMRIYVDGKSVFGAATSKIDSTIGVAAGKHSVNVQAWDSAGAVLTKALSITVNGGSTPATNTGSTAPAGTAGAFNVDQMSGWGSCDKCAGIGANGPTASRSMSNVSSPSLDGNSKQFTIASSTAFADALWWKSMSGNDSKTHFEYDFYFYIKNPAASEALEFDVNQSASKRRYVYGTQCGINYDGQWDVWDTAGGHWRPTGIACKPAAFTWNHVVWEFTRSNGQVHFISVTMNGKKSYVNKTYNSKAWGASEISVAVQLDQRANHATYSAWVDKLNLRYW
jgi:hypothetical protein